MSLTTPTGHLPLRRPPKGRWIAGVCAGLSAHLGISVVAIRVAMALSAVLGVGLVAYVFWWVTIPAGDPVEAARQQLSGTQRALGKRLNLSALTERVSLRDAFIGVGLLIGALLLLATRLGWEWQQTWVIPALLSAGGLALAWSQLDASQRGDGASAARRFSWVRPVIGLLLLVAGILFLVVQEVHGGALVEAALAALAVLAGFALMLAPWWLRLVRELSETRAAQARESERAEIAAHLHDSVLQTLALIRAQADDPVAVARMARAQERELREWMYEDRPAPGTSFAAELRAVVAQVEDTSGDRRLSSAHSARVETPDTRGLSSSQTERVETQAPVAIDVVMVGDTTPTAATSSVLQAAREALVNAVAHGEPPISVYAEATTAALEVFVRDRGEGFDLEAIPSDRFGVRESIVGRMRRASGTAEIVTRPNWGTEVRLRVPLDSATPLRGPQNDGLLPAEAQPRHPAADTAPRHPAAVKDGSQDPESGVSQ